MTGVETTICLGTKGQLLTTIPKQIAHLYGIGKGTKVRWNKGNGKLIGEVII
jgi:hypothetical protein